LNFFKIKGACPWRHRLDSLKLISLRMEGVF
jgi:hypothetical protein